MRYSIGFDGDLRRSKRLAKQRRRVLGYGAWDGLFCSLDTMRHNWLKGRDVDVRPACRFFQKVYRHGKVSLGGQTHTRICSLVQEFHPFLKKLFDDMQYFCGWFPVDKMRFVKYILLSTYHDFGNSESLRDVIADSMEALLEKNPKLSFCHEVLEILFLSEHSCVRKPLFRKFVSILLGMSVSNLKMLARLMIFHHERRFNATTLPVVWETIFKWTRSQPFLLVPLFGILYHQILHLCRSFSSFAQDCEDLEEAKYALELKKEIRGFLPLLSYLEKDLVLPSYLKEWLHLFFSPHDEEYFPLDGFVPHIPGFFYPGSCDKRVRVDVSNQSLKEYVDWCLSLPIPFVDE